MRVEFYERLFDTINKYNEGHIVNIISGTYKNIDISGNKLVKYEGGTFIEDSSLSELWDILLKKLDFDKSTRTIELDNMKIFIEYVVRKPQLIICGGGHIALSLCQIAKILGFETIVIDERIEFANKERFYMADNVICDRFDKALDLVQFTNNTYVVLATRAHKTDKECLEKVLGKNIFYIGMMGSKSKINLIVNELLNKGYSEEEIEKIYAPIGIDIESETPTEIALSICAQLVLIKNKRKSGGIDESILNSIINLKKKMVLATIVKKEGSAPRGVGSKMLILEDGDSIGTVGGGSIENAIYNRAMEVIKEKKSCVEIYNLNNSKGLALGMVCGGSTEVAFEFLDRNKGY